MCAVLDGSGKTLERAKARVHQFAATEPRPYVIFSQKTGSKIVITPDGDAVPPQSQSRESCGGLRASRIEAIAGSESHLPVPLQINNIFACLTATTRARRLKAVVF